MWQLLDDNALRLATAESDASIAHQYKQSPMPSVIEHLDVCADRKTHRSDSADKSLPACQFPDNPTRSRLKLVKRQIQVIGHLARISYLENGAVVALWLLAQSALTPRPTRSAIF
jgi:hypothetical protein